MHRRLYATYVSGAGRSKIHGSTSVGYVNIFDPPTGISPTCATTRGGKLPDSLARRNITTPPASAARPVHVKTFVNCRRGTFGSFSLKVDHLPQTNALPYRLCSFAYPEHSKTGSRGYLANMGSMAERSQR